MEICCRTCAWYAGIQTFEGYVWRYCSLVNRDTGENDICYHWKAKEGEHD